jgi:hypothetical protein
MTIFLLEMLYASRPMLSPYSLIPVLKKAGRLYANTTQHKKTTVSKNPTDVANAKKKMYIFYFGDKDVA